jgi:hypothetical protein
MLIDPFCASFSLARRYAAWHEDVKLGSIDDHRSADLSGSNLSGG